MLQTLENTKAIGEKEKKSLEEILACNSTMTTNCKHSLTSSQINFNLTLKTYLLHTSCLAFNKNIAKYTKRQKVESEWTKKASEPDSDMVEIFKLIDGEFKRPGVVGKGGLEEVKGEDIHHTCNNKDFFK